MTFTKQVNLTMNVKEIHISEEEEHSQTGKQITAFANILPACACGCGARVGAGALGLQPQLSVS